jgi:hypothetical protein
LIFTGVVVVSALSALYHEQIGSDILTTITTSAEQQERSSLLKEFAKFNGWGNVSRKEYEIAGLSVETDLLAWRWVGVGSWLLIFVFEKDPNERNKEKRVREDRHAPKQSQHNKCTGNSVDGRLIQLVNTEPVAQCFLYLAQFRPLWCMITHIPVGYS